MIKSMSLSQLKQALDASLSPNELVGDDVSFDSVSTDTRSLSPGDLYVAFSGDNFDGHDYVNAAVENGCCAVVVEKTFDGLAVPQLVVANTVHAYGLLGRLNRDCFSGPLVAITGSSGKTSVKEMLVKVLAQCGAVHFTEKNFNNQIGVPKTLLQLAPEHQFSVLELGASAVSDISYLVGLVTPQVALVNNIQPAHVEGFGSVDAIAAEKTEIYHGLVNGGCAVVNLDEPFSTEWLPNLTSKRVITFSRCNSGATIFASDISLTKAGCAEFTLHLPTASYPVVLQVVGLHNVSNALAVAAICIALDVEEALIVKGLSQFAGVAGRLMNVVGHAGSRVIDDTYNANPGSVRAAIDVLATQEGCPRYLILGEMGELGQGAAEEHEKIGAYAAEKGIEYLYTVGDLARGSSVAFGKKAVHSEDKASLISKLLSALEVNASEINSPAAVILVKGSRSTHMEDVVNALKQKGNQ